MIVREVIDLFGEKIVERISEAAPGRKPTQPKGYAATPGTGPEGETCKTCSHKRSTEGHTAKVYWKCNLMQHAWTGGPGSDIRMRSPACNRWSARAPASEGGRIRCPKRECQFKVARIGELGTICPADRCGMLIVARESES